jgi:hypothetical protein
MDDTVGAGLFDDEDDIEEELELLDDDDIVLWVVIVGADLALVAVGKTEGVVGRGVTMMGILVEAAEPRMPGRGTMVVPTTVAKAPEASDEGKRTAEGTPEMSRMVDSTPGRRTPAAVVPMRVIVGPGVRTSSTGAVAEGTGRSVSSTEGPTTVGSTEGTTTVGSTEGTTAVGSTEGTTTVGSKKLSVTMGVAVAVAKYSVIVTVVV